MVSGAMRRHEQGVTDLGSLRSKLIQYSNSHGHQHFPSSKEHMEASNELNDHLTSSDEAPQPFAVTTNDAAALLEILFDRGYFHENVTPCRSDQVEFQFKNDTKSDPNAVNKYDKSDALLIETTHSTDSYVMLDTLQQQVSLLLHERGRLTINEASKCTNVSTEVLLRRVVPNILISSESSAYTVVRGAHGEVKEIITSKHINELTAKLWALLQESPRGGVKPLTEVAESIFELPLDVTTTLVEDYIATESGTTQLRLRDNGGKAVVTSAHLKWLKEQITESCLECSDAPVDVRDIAKRNGWETNWVMHIVANDDLGLPGEFHGSTYIPHAYVETKRRSVLESYTTNGYVTSHMCNTMFGILPSQMKEFVTSSTELKAGCLVLTDSVVNRDIIVEPLVEAVHEATESASWVDLQLHIPLELLEHQTNDARELVEVHAVNAESQSDSGFVFIQSFGALFLSQAMIDSFSKNNLSTLIREYAKTTAADMLREADEQRRAGSAIDDTNNNMSGKEKRKIRNLSKAKQDDIELHDLQSEGANKSVPLPDIVQLMLQVYPDLSSIDDSIRVVTASCQELFGTDEFEMQFADAIRIELDILKSEQRAIGSKTVEGVTAVSALRGFHSVEAAFEDSDCFSAACYMIQAKAKFLSYASDCPEIVNDEVRKQLESDFLAGCCADFTSRVTRYALLKNNVEDGILIFRSRKSEADIFYAPVDLACRSYEKVHLSCSREKVGQRHDPLTLLREELPATAGVALARQWILCGGEFYQGGVKIENDQTYTRPGDADAFIKHVRENCLAICGLPFSNLDKKSEKKFLNARRVQLTRLLEETTDAGVALDLRIMLLYQLVKNLVVSGPLLRGPILQLLAKERKVETSVAEELIDIADRLERGESIDETTIERIRSCGAAKAK